MFLVGRFSCVEEAPSPYRLSRFPLVLDPEYQCRTQSSPTGSMLYDSNVECVVKEPPSPLLFPSVRQPEPSASPSHAFNTRGSVVRLAHPPLVISCPVSSTWSYPERPVFIEASPDVQWKQSVSPLLSCSSLRCTDDEICSLSLTPGTSSPWISSLFLPTGRQRLN